MKKRYIIVLTIFINISYKCYSQCEFIIEDSLLSNFNFYIASKPAFIDIDNDSDLDVFIGELEGTIHFYENTGTTTDATFTFQNGSKNPFNGVDVGSFSSSEFSDIDGDGDSDAFIGNSDGAINYYKNTGTANNPVFVLQNGNNNPFNGIDVGDHSTPNFVDIDNDGDKDLFIGGYDGIINFYKNIGSSVNAIFTLQSGSNNPFDGIDIGYFSCPTFTDIDNDGDYDACIGSEDDTIFYYENIGTVTSPAFALQSNNCFNGLNLGYHTIPVFVDIDNDGDQDVYIGENEDNIWYSYIHNTIFFYKNIGNSVNAVYSLQSNNPFFKEDIGSYSFPAFVDIDNNGTIDVFIGSELNGIIYYYKNVGTEYIPDFDIQKGSDNPLSGALTGTYGSTPAFIDIDNDGDQDAFIGENYGRLYFYKNTGTSTAPEFKLQYGTSNPFDGIDLGDRTSPAFVDIDNDGDYDAFVGESTGIIYYYKNLGNSINAIFALQSGSNNPFDGVDVGDRSTPFFMDIDNDGDQDAFIGQYNGTIIYYKNTGTSSNATFVLQSGSNNPFDGVGKGYYCSLPCFVDIDNDDDLDFFMGESRGGISFLPNISLPTPNISYSGTLELCNGSSVILTSNYFNSNCLWNNGESTQSITIKTAGVYYMEIAKNACTKLSNTITITEFEISISGDIIGCVNNPALLTCSTAKSYVWSSNDTSQSMNAIPGTYTVTATSDSGCTLTSDPFTVTDPLAFISVAGPSNTYEIGDTIQLSINGQLNGLSYTYKWSPNTNLSSTTIANPYVYGATEITYYVSVMETSSGCEFTDSITLTPKPLSGIGESKKNAVLFEIFPNPAKENFTIQLNTAITANTQLQISDFVGKLIYSQKIEKSFTTINSSNFKNGIYMLKIVNGNNESLVQKIRIE